MIIIFNIKYTTYHAMVAAGLAQTWSHKLIDMFKENTAEKPFKQVQRKLRCKDKKHS